MFKICVGVLGVVVSDEPVGRLDLLDEGDGVIEGRMAPARFFPVFCTRVLRFMNENV